MAGTAERRFRLRVGLRRTLDRIWPDLPTTGADLPGRLRPTAVQIERLMAAATIAYP